MRDVTFLLKGLKQQANYLGLLEEYGEIIDRLVINEDDLIPEYAEQAALFAFVSVKAEVAYAKRKAAEAEANRVLRDEYGKKKPPENAIKLELQDDKYVQDARLHEGFLSGLADAFKQRMQMLISIGADLREERRSTDLPMPRADRKAVRDDMEDRVKKQTTTPSARAKQRRKKR